MGNLFQLFEAVARRIPSQPAIEMLRRDHLETYDYATLLAMTERIAGALAAYGCKPGSRCVILGDNDARWCATYLAVLRLGAIAVPLDTAYRAAQIRTVIEDSGASMAVVSLRYLQGLQAAVGASSAPVEIVLFAGTADSIANLDEAIDGPAPGNLAPCPEREEDTAVILYTSGTTSDPKGVVLTHGNLLAERHAAFQIVNLNEHDSILGVLPLFHALAQLANLLLPLTIGARVVFLETVSSGEIFRGLAQRTLTAFCCVPQFYYLIYQRVMQKVSASPLPIRLLFRLLLALNGALRQSTGLNLGPLLFREVHRALGSHMRILVAGGSRLDPGVGHALYQLGFNIMQAYGLTECSGAATITRPADRHVESVGPAMPGVELRILHDADQAGRDVADGEVLIRGPIVMKGYHNKPEANAAALQDGWLHTGDLGYLDAAGRLHITGRKKEVIVLANGKNIYPEEIEIHYTQSPFIKEICVLGISRPDEPASERLHAIVVPNADQLRERKIVNTRDLLRFEIEGLSIKLPPHKRVLSFEVWQEDLPRTTTRKLKRFEIERMCRARADTPPAAAEGSAWSEEDQVWASNPLVAQALATIQAAAKPGSMVAPGAHLDLDLGLDSMERVELLTSLEHQFATDVPEELSQQIYTVRQLVEAVRPRGDISGGAVPDKIDPWVRLLASDPDDPALNGILRSSTLFSSFAWLVMKMFGLAARLLVGLRTPGRENIPRQGAFLISPNHESYLDVFLMVAALPFHTLRRLFFVGASEYFATPFMRWLAARLNVVPVDPDANLVHAMQAGAYGLRHGKVLVLFPDGERSPDGQIKKFKKGAAILSVQLGVPIVPVAIEGVYEVWPRKRALNWRSLVPGSRARARIRFGTPLSPALVADARPEERYARMTEQLRDVIVRMWLALRQERLGET
jgi:long-chain acyl-CoA synthetase